MIVLIVTGQTPRYRSTANTLRWSAPETGRSSFVKMLATCFSTARSLTKRAAAIAKAMFVSERAVEKHVASIFTKLDLPVSGADHRRVLAVLRYLGV